MKTVPFVLLFLFSIFGGGNNAAPPPEFTLERVQSVYKALQIERSGVYQKDGIVFAAFLCDISGRKNYELDSLAIAGVCNMLREKFGINPPFKIKCKNVANVKSALTEKFLYVNAYPLQDIKDLKAAQDLQAEQAAKAAQAAKEAAAKAAARPAAESEPPKRKRVNLAYDEPPAAPLAQQPANLEPPQQPAAAEQTEQRQTSAPPTNLQPSAPLPANPESPAPSARQETPAPSAEPPQPTGQLMRVKSL